MIFLFCPQCGDKLTHNKTFGDEGIIPFCEKCRRPWFGFSYPCVICLVIDKDNNIALIKQSYVSDSHVCVAGYIKEGETAECTAKREVFEETGLNVLSLKYINSYHFKKNDNLMLGFVCLVKKDDFSLSCEVDSADWFTLDEAKLRLRTGSIGLRLLNDYLSNNK